MKPIHGFSTLRTIEISEFGSVCRHYKHIPSGAELISVSNNDENKVFGITFGTPPRDSTGLAHILEHSVLCGSRKYPVKEPFVELMKGSLNTFLNAFTYPDRTCFPVASQNTRDLYNLADVYMDAVFHPLIDEWTFKQEAWHYAISGSNAPLRRSGVVYNEMRGVFSSPENLLREYSQHALFPDSIYGKNSGGDPEVIPTLDFASMCAFKDRYYHPSNARIWFWGDDDPEERLIWLNQHLGGFTPKNCEAVIPPQPRFTSPRRIEMAYASPVTEQNPKAMFTVNWLQREKYNAEQVLTMHILEEILIGQPASPLRRTLISNGLGESLIGCGLESDLRQMYFSIGLKGIESSRIAEAEALIYATLKDLVRDGIPANIVQAARNTVEFSLREWNTGRYPQGLMMMLTSLSTWLYGLDPFMLLPYERSLADIAAHLEQGDRVFEDLLEEQFVENTHRVTLSFLPDEHLGARNARAEEEELEAIKSKFVPSIIDRLVRETKELQERQSRQDSEEALQALPSLEITDLSKEIKRVASRNEMSGLCPLFVNEIETYGIAYIDIAFDIEKLPEDLLPWVRTWAAALTMIGTDKEDYASFATRIASVTGGIRPAEIILPKVQGGTAAYVLLRCRVLASRANELIAILEDMLTAPRFGDHERLKRIILSRKGQRQEDLITAGHLFAESQARAMLHPSAALAEQVSGLAEFRALSDASEEAAAHALRRIHAFLVNAKRVRFSLTASRDIIAAVTPVIEWLGFIMSAEPQSAEQALQGIVSRAARPVCLTAPVQVFYTAKGLNMAGYIPHGAARMAARALSMVWLWDTVRVQGGAYGAACRYNPHSGLITMSSYRDPQFEKTLDVYDAACTWLSDFAYEGVLRKQAIIGAIGELDTWQMPDARGLGAFTNHLTGLTDEMRQIERDQIFSASRQDFIDFAEALKGMTDSKAIALIGAEAALRPWADANNAELSALL
ncbi:MAG: insulinase family protein [Spirochaetota bacterium]|jgi:Zn-dependent M16 (insulinase) family peptidase|nr:insulinase family protein [Spirochaetota bacterium]